MRSPATPRRCPYGFRRAFGSSPKLWLGLQMDWRMACQRLQEEIEADLIPLIGEQPHVGLDCLDSLLDKISHLDLHFRWYAESTQHQGSDATLRTGTKRAQVVGRQKFVVCRQPTTFESFRELFLWHYRRKPRERSIPSA
jgi:hypothetical protein